MIQDGNQILLLVRNDTARLVLDFVGRSAFLIDSSLDDDALRVNIRSVCIGPIVGQVDGDNSGTRGTVIGYPLRLTTVATHLVPSLMKELTDLPRLVALAFAPSATVMAVRMALLPLPLWPMMKLILGPRSICKNLWHIKLTHSTREMVPASLIACVERAR